MRYGYQDVGNVTTRIALLILVLRSSSGGLVIAVGFMTDVCTKPRFIQGRTIADSSLP